jgi:hypothetical protein
MAPSAYPSLSWCGMPMAALSVAMLFFSVGCGTSLTSGGPLVAGSLRGNIHGGEQPISGAQIQLYAAGTMGDGAGEVPLLQSPVFSDANGNFSITGDYTCPSSSSQIFMVATGGNPGGLPPGTSNPAIALMAALGPCSLHGGQYTLDPNSVISINEVTTVASVYALASFMDSDADDLGASGRNLSRLANAFLKVKSLVDTSTGAALPGADQATINTLADILAACVNSDGTGAPCSTLFALAPPGRTEPPDTIEAIYDIATQPNCQVSVLYGLVPTSPPFQPTLTTAPNDWTLP